MIKQALIGTAIGELALKVRSTAVLVKQAIFLSETIGMQMNDDLAGKLVCSLCKTDKTFIDVGAHIGSVISGVKRHSQPSKIIAFEAMPDKAKKLRYKFPDVEILNYAVSDEKGIANFYVNDNASGYSSLNNSKNTTRQISVETDLIDNLVTADNVDVIKLDIEGAELAALKGAVNLIKNCQPVIMFESGPVGDGDTSKQEMWAFFHELEYEIFIPNRVAHVSPGLSLEMFLDSHNYPRRTTNYFAIPKARLIEIRQTVAQIL